jgi:hypothetical protein
MFVKELNHVGSIDNDIFNYYRKDLKTLIVFPKISCKKFFNKWRGDWGRHSFSLNGVVFDAVILSLMYYKDDNYIELDFEYA